MNKLMSALLASAFAVSITAAAQNPAPAPGTGRHVCRPPRNEPHDTNQRRKGATTLTYLPGGISRVNNGT